MNARDNVRKWMIDTGKQDELLDAYRAEVLAEGAAHVEGDRLISPDDETEEHLNDVLTRLAAEIRALPAERGEQR